MSKPPEKAIQRATKYLESRGYDVGPSVSDTVEISNGEEAIYLLEEDLPAFSRFIMQARSRLD